MSRSPAKNIPATWTLVFEYLGAFKWVAGEWLDGSLAGFFFFPATFRTYKIRACFFIFHRTNRHVLIASFAAKFPLHGYF